MSGVSGNHDADIDVGQLMSAVWERRLRILATTIVAGGIAFAVVGMIKPDYKAETRILIETRETAVAGRETQGASDPVLDQYNIVSQAQLLQSTDLIRRVAKDLKLSELKEFDPDVHSLLPNPGVLLGVRSNPMDLAPEERVLKAFREKLQVYPVEGSRVIAIEFSSNDPALAAAVPNKMAEVYLSMQSSAKIDSHEETTRWLEPEIARLREKVQEAEKKVADYRTSAGLYRSSDNTSFSDRQLNDISTELARVRTERATAEARAENVRRALSAGTGYDTLADVVASPVVQRLKETEANIQAQIADLSTSLMDGHPRLKGLRAQLAGIRQQIQSETRKILAAAEGEAQVAKLREDQLNAQLTKMKADSARAGEEEVGLRALERDAASQRQLLETYLARYREAASRADRVSTPADARIVSTALEPTEPYFPKVIPITIVVALATLVLYVLGIIVGALFSGRALRPSVEDDDIQTVPSPVVAVRRNEIMPPPGMIKTPKTNVAETTGDLVAERPSDLAARLKARLLRKKEKVALEEDAESRVLSKEKTSLTALGALQDVMEPTTVSVQEEEPLVQRGNKAFGLATPTQKPETVVLTTETLTKRDEAVLTTEASPVVPVVVEKMIEEKVEAADVSPSSSAEVIVSTGQEAEAEAQPVADSAKVPAAAEVEKLGALSLETVRDLLARSGVPLAITVSPSGDDGSTATVLLAREMAEMGRSVVLVDMTGSASPTRLMAGSARLAGITDLLCGTTAFGNTIHPDRLSDAHIIPQGVADAAQAMRGADRLTMVFDALSGAYDIVIVECGQADPKSLERLSAKNEAQVLLSLPNATDDTIEEQLKLYRDTGYKNVLAMTTDLSGRPSTRGRRDAA